MKSWQGLYPVELEFLPLAWVGEKCESPACRLRVTDFFPCCLGDVFFAPDLVAFSGETVPLDGCAVFVHRDAVDLQQWKRTPIGWIVAGRMFFTVFVSVTIGVGLRAGCCLREYREILPLP